MNTERETADPLEPHSVALELTPSRFRHRVLLGAEMLLHPPPEWLVEAMIPETGDGMFYGATGTGKTFCVLDLALTIASGLPSWIGRR